MNWVAILLEYDVFQFLRVVFLKIWNEFIQHLQIIRTLNSTLGIFFLFKEVGTNKLWTDMALHTLTIGVCAVLAEGSSVD